MLAAPHPVRWLVLDCSGIPDVDYSAGSALKTLIAFVHHRGAILGLAAVDPDLKQTLTQLGVLAQVRPEHLFPTVTEAVAAFRQVPVEQAFVPVPPAPTPAGDGDAPMPPAAAADRAPSSDPVVRSGGVPMSAEHPSVADRSEVGAAARRKVPLTDHGQWEPAADRVDPVSVLTAQDASREADLVPIRHGRMSASPFAFFRGGAAIMAADLATAPNSGLVAQLCGDAHAVNFGLYASPERRLLFDVNDFDETLPGPFEWDVKRLAASIAIVAHGSHFSAQEIQNTTRATVAAYRRAMRDFADRSILDIWYASIAQQDLRAAARSVRRQVLADDAAARRHKKSGRGRHDLNAKRAAKLADAAERLVRNNIHRARMRTNLAALAELTEVVRGRRRIISTPPVVLPLSALAKRDADAADAIRETVSDRLATYAESLPADRRSLLSRYEVVDVARKVVGVGSVGMLDFIVLLQGRDVDDALFLQVKQAGRSVLADHLPVDPGGASR